MFTQHKMLAYRNGKSAGKCAEADWHGPHRFTGSYHVVPVSKACVLHFESCLYEQVMPLFHGIMCPGARDDVIDLIMCPACG